MIYRSALFSFCLLALDILFAAPVDAAARFLICPTTCTITAADTGVWSASSGGATGASVPGAADTVTLDAATCTGGTTCTATLNFGGTWTIQSFTMGACTASTTGCIFDNSVNNNNIIATASSSGFSWTGSGVRVIRWGTATYTMTNNLARWNFTTATNATTTGSPNVVFSGGTAAKTFDGGGRTYGSVVFGPSSGAGYSAITSGNNTIGTLTITGPNYVEFNTALTTTVTTALLANGSAGNPIGIFNNATAGTTSTIAVPPDTVLQYVSLRDVTFTGSPIAVNSFDLGGVSGITVTGPTAGGGGGIIGGN